MFAVFADSTDPDDPLRGLALGERPEPEVPDGWTVVTVRASTLNRHDLWSLRGVGLKPDQLPMILGCDAAGIDVDGTEVVVHSVIASADWMGDETLDPKRTLLSELHPGTHAARVAVPRRNLLPKPADLSFEEAACLPTAWLTAYRMLFTQAHVVPGTTVLVQGAGGGVSTALVALGAAAGARVWVTSRDPNRASRALKLGAAAVFEAGARLPERVDAVMETVGEATWEHSVRSLRPGGTLVVSGATSGRVASTELNRLYFLQLRILGSTMGSRQELSQLLQFCSRTGARPVIDRVLPLDQARHGFAALERGQVFGKIVLTQPS
jgi:NADPH:quinone reductase-like Zn-dependent oxidoreductase